MNKSDQVFLASFLVSLEQRFSLHDGMLFTITECRNLNAHGESFVAFENLLSNLYEFEVPLSREDLKMIEELSSFYGLSRDKWDFLLEQVSK